MHPSSRFHVRSLTRFAVSILVAWPLALSLHGRLSHAAEIHPLAGTTSASFLKIGIGSRAIGMGGAFGAISDDVTAIYWNPAGLAQLSSPEAVIAHTESFENIRHDFVGYAWPLRSGTLGFSAYGLHMPSDIERRTGLRENDPYEPITPIEGYFGAYDFALNGAYARRLSPYCSVGAGIKVIQQSIDDTSAYSIALDVGTLHSFTSLPLQLGFGIQNAGMPVKFREESYPLPLNFRGGASYRFNDSFIAALDLNKPIDNFLFVSAGVEYTLRPLLALRLGYKYRMNGLELGDLSGMSGGIGFNFKLQNLPIRLDYAFLPFGDLGNSHRLSLNVMFASPGTQSAVSRERTEARPAVVVSTAVALPPEPVAAGPSARSALDGYRCYVSSVSYSLSRASGRRIVFAVRGESESGDVRSWKGNLLNPAARTPFIRIGEKEGTGKVLKYFAFQGDIIPWLHGLDIILRLPDTVEGPVVKTADTRRSIPLEKTGAQEGYSFYTFRLAAPEPFYVVIK